MGFLAAVIVSMAFIVGSSGIKSAIAQGTNETSSSSGMNMIGTEEHGGSTNESLLLDGSMDTNQYNNKIKINHISTISIIVVDL
ncbi:MAG TPA: hypothetical protein VE593_07455 [Nitrososphaeraceae archaeon]|nr:hypothetical protein [Nitrososphaeraceae archaeon]